MTARDSQAVQEAFSRPSRPSTPGLRAHGTRTRSSSPHASIGHRSVGLLELATGESAAGVPSRCLSNAKRMRAYRSSSADIVHDIDRHHTLVEEQEDTLRTTQAYMQASREALANLVASVGQAQQRVSAQLLD